MLVRDPRHRVVRGPVPPTKTTPFTSSRPPCASTRSPGCRHSRSPRPAVVPLTTRGPMAHGNPRSSAAAGPPDGSERVVSGGSPFLIGPADPALVSPIVRCIHLMKHIQGLVSQYEEPLRVARRPPGHADVQVAQLEADAPPLRRRTGAGVHGHVPDPAARGPRSLPWGGLWCSCRRAIPWAKTASGCRRRTRSADGGRGTLLTGTTR